jgi:hypothetical protein
MTLSHAKRKQSLSVVVHEVDYEVVHGVVYEVVQAGVHEVDHEGDHEVVIAVVRKPATVALRGAAMPRIGQALPDIIGFSRGEKKEMGRQRHTWILLC